MKQVQQLEILKRLIAIPSVNGREAAVADYLTKLFIPYQDQIQIERVTYAPGRDNLVITAGQGAKTLGLAGHMDVVPPEIWLSGRLIPLKPRLRPVVYTGGARVT